MPNDSPITGTWGSSITGTWTIAADTIDSVVYVGAVFGAGGGQAAVLQGPGTLDSSGNASVNQYSGATTQLALTDGVTWDNAGTITQTGGVQFGASAGDSATLVNDAGAIYYLNGGNAQVTTGGAGTYDFVNAGLLEMYDGGNDTLGVPLDNSGTVVSTNGNFYLSGPVTNSGTLVADGGFLEIQGGTLGGTIAALNNNVGLIGTYSVAASTVDTVTFGNAYLGWAGDGDAVFAGPGTLVSNGYVNVYQYNYAQTRLQLIDGITWDNAGTVNQIGGLEFGGSTIDTATIVNQAGATYQLDGGNAQITDDPGGTYDFVNDGLLQQYAGGNDTLSVPLNNSGTVASTNGNFYLSGPVINSGTLVADGGFLEVQGGTLGGTIEAISNNLGLVGTYSVASGTVDTVTFESAYLGWGSDGDAVFAGPGTIASNGFVYVYQYNYAQTQLQLTDGITWENAGTVRQYGGLEFGGSSTDTATIVNQEGATYELWGGNAQVGNVAGGTYNFINDGLLEMIAGGSVTITVPLSNSGTVLSTNGNLYVSSLVTNTGTLVADGGFIEVQGGTLGGTIEALSNNVGLIGTYDVAADTIDTVTFGNANLGWYGDGYAVFAGPGTLVSNGDVAVSAYDYSSVQLQLIDGITWYNAGTVNQYGGLVFGGSTIDTATIVNQAGATYVLNGGNAQISDTAGGTYNFVNAGTLELVNGGGVTVSVPLTNTGLVTSIGGNLILAGPVTNSGTMLANGGELYIEGGTLGGTIGVGPNGSYAYLTGTYAIAAGVTDTVTLGGATFGDGGGAAIAYVSGSGTLDTDGSANIYAYYYSDPDLVLENGITWDNFGAINQLGGLQFGDTTGDTATVINETGATWTLNGGNAYIEQGGTSGNYSFVNNGLLQLISGGGVSIAVPLDNTGVISSDNGEIYIDGPLTNSGTIQTAGGSVQINGGTLGGTLNAANGAIWILGTYTLAGGTTDTVTLGSATFGDGGGSSIAYLSGSGTLATDGSATVTAYYYSDPDLVLENGATWDNFGAINQLGGVQLGNVTGDTATVVNEAGATWTLNGGNAWVEQGGTSGTYSFVNNGLLQQIDGGSVHIEVPLDNTGVVSSDNGEIYIDGPLTNSGTIVTAGGSVQIDGGGSLGGTLDAANGAIWVEGTYTAAHGVTDTASFTSVTFGNGASSIAYLSGPGTLATSGSASITNYYYNDPDLVLMGGITWDNSGALYVNAGLQFGNQSGDGATLVMEAGSVLDLTNGEADLEAPYSGTYSLVESGLLEMTGGGTDTISVAVDETNTGTITASNGTLDFDDGATIAGAVNGSQTINFYGNVTLAATGDVTASNVSFNSGTLFMQGGTINSPDLTLGSGEYVVGYGTLGDANISAITIDASGGLLTVTGPVNGAPNYEIETGSTLELTNSSSRPVTFDGTDATLKLDSASSFTGTINNFAGGDTIDLAGVTLSAVSYVGGDLIGTLAAGGTISLSAPAVEPGLQLELGTDATGGSTIYLQPSTVTAIPDLLTTLGPNNGLVLPDSHVYVPIIADPILEIENAATAPADGLDVSVVQTTGSAYAQGQITSLAPQAINDSSIDVGLNDETAGPESGTVSLAYATDGSVSGISGSAGTAATFTEIDLSPYVNAYFTSDLADVGYLLNGSEYSPIIGDTTGNQGTGIPFLVANSPGNLWFGLNGASSVTVPVGIAANTVYTLTDNVKGTSGADEYSITFTPVSGSPITEQYVGGENTKDYNNNPNTDGTDTTPQAAYWFVTSSGNQWLQEVAWTLPAGFGTLASVTMTQENATDGALFAGLTVGTASSDLGTQTLNLSGNVYRLADPSISAPTNVYLHVGDGGGTYGENLTVANIDPADGYSEGLDAAAINTPGGDILSSNGATADIAAGGSDNSSITVEIPTATAGTVNGFALLALTSDGSGVDTLGLTPLDGGTVYSAVGDFSLASNANGVWSYLDNGTLLADPGSSSTIEYWNNGGSQPNAAVVALNPTTTTQTYSGTVVLPPTYLDLDPQATGNVSVEFTAPSGGVYTFSGSILGTDTNEQSHEVAVTVDGSVVASATLSHFQQTIPIDLTETLTAGDTVNFISYSGSTYNNLGTGLSLTVTDDGQDYVPVSATIDNYATAAIQQAGGAGTLSASGDTYTLNFGNIVQAPGAVAGTLDVANIATGQADWLSGSLSASGDAAFSDEGLGSIGTVSAGDSTPLVIDLSTANAGTFSQTITLAASSINPDGGTLLPGETITVTGTVLSTAVLAAATIDEPSPIVLPDVHIASLVANDQTTLDIKNTGSDVLSGTVTSATGDAYGSGIITDLPIGQSDTTDIVAGLNNTQAGSLSGTVNLSFTSGTADVPLSPQSVTLEGDVYRYADPSITNPAAAVVHVGDGVSDIDSAALVISNNAPNDGFSENLDATALSVVSGDLTATGGTAAEIAAGGANTTSATFSFSTAAAGVVGGTVAVSEISDGSTIDTLGTTPLGTVDVPVGVTVDNYATAAIHQTSGPGELVQTGSVYTLNIGDLAQGVGNAVAGLDIANTATGPADWLAGSLASSGDSAFTAYFGSGTAALSATYFEVSTTGNGPDFGGSGTPNVQIGSTLGPDGLPVASSPAGVSDVDPSTQEITWWDPSLNSGVVETGTGAVSLPYGSNMYAPNSTGSNDSAYFETAILQGGFSLSSAQSVTFQLGSDDDSFIYVDGTLIGSEPGIHGAGSQNFTASDLAAGTHTVEVFYDDREQAGAYLQLNVLTPGVTITPTNAGTLGAFAPITAGNSTPFAVDLSTANSGVFTETVTLAANGANASGYSEALAGQTLVVTGTVLPTSDLANPVINTSTPIVLADAHVATVENDRTLLSISNTGSAALSAVVNGTTGNAYGSGEIDNLAIGGTDASDIAVGLNNTTAGSLSGNVTLGFSSGGDNLLTDGSFEDTSDFAPPNNDTMELSVGSTAMAGWTVVGSEPLDWIGPTNPFGLAAENGSYLLDLTGYNSGTPFSGVSQTIATTAGDQYQLSFELGSSSNGGLPDGITASAGGTSQTFTSTLSGTNNWQLETLDFTAAGTATTISLVGASGDNYIGLDDVSVTPEGAPPLVALNPQTVAVTGSVYNYATASITGPSNVIVHVGDGTADTETEALTVVNTAAAGNYSEGLEATALGGAGGEVSGATGTTGDIMAQGTDDTSLTVSISTATAATTGNVAVAETSDGTNVDTLGTTSLGTVDVPVYVTVDNYATAAMEQTGGNGSMTPNATVSNTYTLDLGSTEQYTNPLTADLAEINAAAGPAADQLDGSYTITGDSEYADTGFGAFSGINYGNALGGNTVELNTGTIGVFTQQITLTPTGTNASGYSGTLAAETIDVVGTIVPVPPPPPPPLATAIAWGDVHLTTFDGLYYNFQAEGEFILAQSTVAGDTFAVQARMAPYSANSTVSVMTMIGADVGGQQVTFGLGRDDVVAIGGVGQTFAGNGSSIALAGGGSVTQLTSTSYQLTWGTGEVMDVTDAGSYFNLNLTLSATDPGNIQGLLGSDTGQANDFQLADGTVLAQPLTSAELYGAFANAWRVTSGPDGNSLMDYVAGQTTATFTDVNFPADAVNVDNLPAAILQQAELEVQQAGITDPNQQAAAVLDLLVTGNPNALLDDVDVGQNGEITTAAEISVPPPPVPALGVSAVATNVVENAGGTTNVTFNAYLTNASGTDTVIDWAVTSPNATYLTPASLGSNPTSGFVTIPAGQTTGEFTVTLPTGVLGTDPSANLQVSISSTNGDPVFGQTAQTEIDNYQPVAGNPAIPQLTLASGAGTFSGSDGDYTLNLGTLVAGEAAPQSRFQIANDALAPSDFLEGSISASGSNFDVFGATQLSPLAAGTSYQGLVTEADTSQTGPQSETIVYTPVDENITGYSSIMPAQTVTVTDTVLSDAVGDLLTGGPLNLGTFYQGANSQTPLDIENAAASGAASLDVTASSSGEATVTGEIRQLGATDSDDSTIQAGIDTSSPGVKTGYITLDYASDAGNGNVAGAGTQTIEVVGTVYGPAVASVAAPIIYVHKGDDGGSVTVPITISNIGTNNGFQENLDAQVVSFGTYVTAASGSVTDLEPGFSNDTSIAATLSDANYGTYAGEVEIALQSGSTIDSEGTTSLGMAYVQAAIDVDQYAVAAMQEIGGNGTMVPTGVSTSYSLDLGTVAQYATPLGANIAVLNDVLGQSDLLAGSFSASGAPEFTNSGLGPFGPGTEVGGLAAGQEDTDPVVVLSSATVGVFTETLTLDAGGYNPDDPTGYALAPETVTITGTVVAAPPPTPVSRVSDAWGDVHLTTFDGLYYNFQAAGEFVLSESTIPGDTFQIQARMQPYNGSSSVSVNTMVAAQVGSDRVTFGIDRTDTVWIDGQGVSLSGNPVVTLAGGTLEQTSADSYRLVWNTGEELDITDNGSYLNATVSLPNSDAGHVQGLLGNDAGNPADDLTLPNGTPIETNGSISYAELYGTYAASWEVTDSTSLMDYQSGQNAESFYNPNFPYNQILLGNLPPNAYQEALAAAEAAGITDPNLLQAAIVDYLFTGNPAALEASENVQQQEGTGVTSGQTVTATPAPVADLGVLANEPTVVELTGTADAIGFTAYLTSPEATDTLVDYSVNGNAGPGYLNASDFPGDILPNGTVTIAAGQTSALFTVAIPAAVLGDRPDANLQVVISPVNPEQSVFAPEAQTEILNTGPTAGNPATPLVELLSGDGVLSGSSTAYELNLGSVEQYSNPLLSSYGVENDGIIPADLLSGSFEVSGSSQFLNSGLSPFAPIPTGDADTAPEVELLTNTVGTFTENVTLTPTDSNLTNYSSIMPQVTIEVVGTIVAPPPPPPPPVPEATAWGDVHLTTFDGVYYNFQAAGEYVLTRSTVAGDTFQVQARLQPWGANSSVTVQTQVGAAIGTDDVVFALTGTGYNDSPLYLNGTAEALGIGQTLNLSDGSVTETSANTYRVNWDTGESMTVTENGSYISDTIQLTAADSGDVQGLLGPDDGNPSTDLQLPDGQSIASNGTISSSELYGQYATDWQVQSSPQSLLYYGTDQSFDGFNIPGFPEDALTLSQLPANLVAAAKAIVEAEGITNPNLIDAAVIDLLVTGDPNSVFSTENVQEEGVLLNSAAVSIPTPLPAVGIMADSTTALEPATGTLAVDYTIYLTAAAAQTSTVDYSVTGSGPNNLGTADIVGGTGSGVVQIAAGQTSTQIVVDVLANALGSLPDAELQVGVTATGGETLFGSSAETEIVNPTPTAGNPAEALIEQLAGDGHLSGGGTDYALNLGTQVQNGPDLYANLGIENGATVPADDLSGQFNITNFENFLNTGFVPFSNIAPGAADTEPAIELGTGTIGVYTETVVLDPTDTNDSGYSSPQNDVTLTVTGTIVPMPLPPPPSLPTATAWGDVHLTTFDGLYYNFQAVGEFTLAKSTVDNFNVQIRTTQYGGSSVSVMDQVAAGFGDNQHVTFGTSASQPATVLLNGGAANFVNGVLTLTDGSTVTEESPTSYVVNWVTGESMTVNVAGSYINTTVALASPDRDGHVEGLLGYDTGVNNDFSPIVSGTTITTNQLYYGSGTPGDPDSLADYWRVAQGNSLLYYANGTSTNTYTNIGFPADAFSLSDLPTALQQEGLQEAVQAGITDPQLQQAAALDFIVTGDPDIVTGGANVQQQGVTTTDSDVTGATITPALGVSANNAALVEPASGNLDVGFTVYLTEAEAQASTVDWSVEAPNGGYLNASDFAGDILPSGSVVIAAGSTSASFSVEVNAGVLADLPSSDLQVMITPTGTEAVFAPTAQTTIVNNQTEPGTPSDPMFALLGGEGTLTHNGTAYVLNLGTFSQGETVDNLSFAVENAATIGSNGLAGSLTADSVSGYTVYGTGPLGEIAPGASYQDLHVAVNTGVNGAYSESITFTPEDQNATGYSASLTPITLKITDAVTGNYASAAPITPNPVDFLNVHQGSTPSQFLSVENSAPTASGDDNLDGSIGSATGAATDNGGSFTGLQPGTIDSSSLSVGLVTTSEGVQSGSAVVTLNSDGTGIDSDGITPLPSQTIDVVGTVYGYAAPMVSASTLDFGPTRVGGTVAAQSLSIANGTTADPYQENLLYALQNTPPTGFIAGSDDSGTIVSGSSASASLDLNTATAGTFNATDTLSLTSTGLGTSGLGTTDLPSSPITLEGMVFAAAVAQVGTLVNFGVVHVNATAAQLLNVANTATGALTDVLVGSIAAISGSGFSSTGSLGAGVAAGSSVNLGVTLSTADSGVFSGSATLDLASHDAYQADEALSVAPVTLTGTVDNYATAAISEVSGQGTLTQSGSHYTLNLNTLSATSSPVVIDLAVNNTATGLSDLLSGSFTEAGSAEFINSGFAAFSGVGAGQTATIDPSVTLGPGNFGTFTETFTLTAQGTNASGYLGTLTPETLTVTGMVLPVIDLTTHAETVNGASNVTIVATANELLSGDKINGGGGTNTLDLVGGGVFNLAAPGVLTNIQVVNATEGSGAAMPSIVLRSGLNVTLNLLDPSGTNGAVIHGAADDDVINLGSGNDNVYLGSSGETVNGGSGDDTYFVTALTIGGTIVGGSGTNNLDVQGGGTMTMGANISGMNYVFLLNSGTAYNFTANATPNMVIHAGADNATITVGNSSQTVFGSTGSLEVLATAALAGVTVHGGTGSNLLEITNGGSIALNTADSNVTVELEAATTLALTTNASVAIDGVAGNDVFMATANVMRAGEQITGGGTDNTLVLQGGGSFNLALPTTLSNIQVVDATEGQGSAKPTITLRGGTDLTLNLASAATNPTLAGAVVHGANNDDTIKLGAGIDTVYLGGTGETVDGGSGTDTYYVTALTIGGTIAGGSGTNTLDVQNGGTMTMGANISGINAVYLLNAGTSYDFTANATANMVIHASTDHDTITVGNISQSVIGSSGSLDVLATAALAGVAISGGSGSKVLEITTGGSVVLNSADSNLKVELEAASTLTLPTNTSVVIDGIAGNDVFLASAGVLRAGQQITGGGSDNTLDLVGGGLFNLAAPAVLNNIQVVDATEGPSGDIPQIILRNGTDLTLNLASAASNPGSAGAVIHGANNDDTIKLGEGNDNVYLGGTGETVDGGSGDDTYYVTALTIGGTIVGGSGTNNLDVQNGGTMAMGANISGINYVFLLNAGTSYDFTANATAGMVIHASADNDTITVGSSSQLVIGSTGSLDVLATAANAGVAIRSASGSNEANNVLNITTAGTVALSSTDNELTVQLDAANTTLTLDHMAFIHAEGTGGNDVIIAGKAGQTLTGGGTGDTLEDAGHYGVTFQDTAVNFDNETLADFTKLDTIDITGFAGVTSPPTYTGNASAGVLKVIGSSGTVDIQMSSFTTGGVFSAASDGHGGTLIHYT